MSLFSGSLTRLILLAFLFIAAWLDRRTEEIPLFLPGAGIAAGILLRFLTGPVGVLEILLGFLPGLLLLVLAFLSKQAVGYGDGAVFLAAGAFLGLEKTAWLLAGALIAAGMAAFWFLLFRKQSGKRSLPFVPFVLAGYVFLLVWI